jgi:hypothetical protein
MVPWFLLLISLSRGEENSMRTHGIFSRTFFYTVLVAFLVLFSSSLRATPPLAVLMACQGDITVLKGNGEKAAAAFGYQLEAGDVVTTGAESSAEILFEDGNWIAMGAGSSMRIKGSKKRNDPAPAPKEKNFQVVQNFLKLKDSGGTSSLAGLRSGAQSKEISLESPCQTRIRGAQPIFLWTASDPELELCLTIYDENGIFWKADIENGDHSVTYPSDAPTLVPGVSYSWTVETTDPLLFPPLRSQAAFFELLAPEDEQHLANSLDALSNEKELSEASYHLYKASLFFEHQLLEEAIGETKMALERDPENTALHSILARLYAEAGRNQDALHEYDRLLDKK